MAPMREFVTLVYVAAIFLGSMAAGVQAIPLTVLALTASYGILMLLIWLYERYPPGPDSGTADD
jgi:hypothetical protein